MVLETIDRKHQRELHIDAGQNRHCLIEPTASAVDRDQEREIEASSRSHLRELALPLQRCLIGLVGKLRPAKRKQGVGTIYVALRQVEIFTQGEVAIQHLQADLGIGIR